MLQTAGMVRDNYHIKPPTEKTIIRDYKNMVKTIIKPLITKDCKMYDVVETKIKNRRQQKWLKK